MGGPAGRVEAGGRWLITWGGLRALAAVAQTGVRLGPVVGANLSTLRVTDPGEPVDIDSRVGPLFGGFVSVDVSRNVSLQPELLFTRRGAGFAVEDADATLKLDYVQVPVLARLRFPGSGVTPYLMAGPAVAFKAGCKARLEDAGLSVEFDCDDPDLDLVPFKGTSLSGIIGAGLEVGDFVLSLRYDHGFTNILNEVSAGESARNRAFTVTVGYGFRLGAQ